MRSGTRLRADYGGLSISIPQIPNFRRPLIPPESVLAPHEEPTDPKSTSEALFAACLTADEVAFLIWVKHTNPNQDILDALSLLSQGPRPRPDPTT